MCQNLLKTTNHALKTKDSGSKLRQKLKTNDQTLVTNAGNNEGNPT
jgi:hypothetical protein